MCNHLRIIKLLTVAEFRKQLKERKAGFLWLILEPLFLISIFVLFLGEVLKKSNFEGPFSVLILVGLLAWQTFSRAIFSGLNYQEKYEYLLPSFGRVKFLLALPQIIYGHMYLLAAIFLLIPLAIHFGYSPNFLFLLFSFSLQVVICWLITSVIGYIYIKAKDIKPTMAIILRGMWFLSPILYLTESFLEHMPNDTVKSLFFLNPMVMCIDLYRKAIGFEVDIYLGSITGYCVVFCLFVLAIFLICFGTKSNKEKSELLKETNNSIYIHSNDNYVNEFIELENIDNYAKFDPNLKIIPELTLRENITFYHYRLKLKKNHTNKTIKNIEKIYDFDWNCLSKKIDSKDSRIFRQLLQIFTYENIILYWVEPRIYAEGETRNKLYELLNSLINSERKYIFISSSMKFYEQANLKVDIIKINYD